MTGAAKNTVHPSGHTDIKQRGHDIETCCGFHEWSPPSRRHAMHVKCCSAVELSWPSMIVVSPSSGNSCILHDELEHWSKDARYCAAAAGAELLGGGGALAARLHAVLQPGCSRGPPCLIWLRSRLPRPGAAPAAAAVAHSRVLNGHAEDEAAALTTADRSRVAASPWQSSYYSEEPASVLPYSNGGACSHASGSPAAADSCRALSAGVAALNLEEGTAVQAAGDCSHEGLDSALVDVFESRGLCRGEHLPGQL